MSAVPYGSIYGFGAPMQPAISLPGATMTPVDTGMAAPSFSQAAGFGYGSPAGAVGNDIFGFGKNLQTAPAAAPTDPAAGGGATKSWWGGDPNVAGDGVKGWLGNGQNLSALFQGIGALTQAYLGFQQLKLAKDNLSLQKESYRTNLANSEQSYNTSLEDRIRGRTADYAGKEEDVQGYLSANRLRQSKP